MLTIKATIPVYVNQLCYDFSFNPGQNNITSPLKGNILRATQYAFNKLFPQEPKPTSKHVKCWQHKLKVYKTSTLSSYSIFPAMFKPRNYESRNSKQVLRKIENTKYRYDSVYCHRLFFTPKSKSILLPQTQKAFYRFSLLLIKLKIKIAVVQWNPMPNTERQFTQSVIVWTLRERI